MNGFDDVARLREEIHSLSRRIQLLESRLETLESGRSVVPAAVHPEGQSMESRVGLTWVNRAGAVTLAMGVLFLFNYAVEKEWITIWGRIILGLLGGAALVLFSDWLLHRGEKAFSQGVYGCGIAVFYISIYFGFDEYRLHHGTVLSAFGVLVAIFGLCFLLAFRSNRTLIFVFNTAWALIASALLLHHSHTALFVCFVFALSALHWVVSGRSTLLQKSKTALYILGHICFMVAVMQWLITWINHHALPSDKLSVINEGSSFVFACYAVAMITLGLIRRRALDRLLGLVSIGSVILKLYLYDVWQLDRVYRITAFVALGVLLLSASYLYSRWKDKLDAILTTKSE